MFPFTLLFDMILFRRNPMIYVFGILLMILMLAGALFMAMGAGRPNYGAADFGADIARMSGMAGGDTRPALAAYLPPVPPGWSRRSWRHADGEAIAEGARALGRAGALRAGGDLERFGLMAEADRGEGAVWLLSRGGARIAIGLRRAPQLLPGRGGVALAARGPGAEAGFEPEAEIAAGEGISFARRARALPDTAAPMPYDFYRAEAPGGLLIEVMSDAPRAETERFLAEFTLPMLP